MFMQIKNMQNEEYKFSGIHFLASYMMCDDECLNNTNALKQALCDAVKASGATILDSVDYVFNPNGYTLAIILSESHTSIHTYPEVKSCFVDLFTCGDKCSYEKFNRVLSDYLKPKTMSYQIIKRDDDIQIISSQKICHDNNKNDVLHSLS